VGATKVQSINNSSLINTNNNLISNGNFTLDSTGVITTSYGTTIAANSSGKFIDGWQYGLTGVGSVRYQKVQNSSMTSGGAIRCIIVSPIPNTNTTDYMRVFAQTIYLKNLLTISNVPATLPVNNLTLNLQFKFKANIVGIYPIALRRVNSAGTTQECYVTLFNYTISGATQTVTKAIEIRNGSTQGDMYYLDIAFSSNNVLYFYYTTSARYLDSWKPWEILTSQSAVPWYNTIGNYVELGDVSLTLDNNIINNGSFISDSILYNGDKYAATGIYNPNSTLPLIIPNQTEIIDGWTTSNGGGTWTLGLPFLNSNGDSPWYSVVWSPELTLFCAISSPGAANYRAMTSSDGINWTLRNTSAAGDYNWAGLCWSPEKTLFVAVSYSASNTKNVMTSPDGVTWTSRTTPAYALYSVCWSKETTLFCAVGNNAVMTSPDATTWTYRAAAPNTTNTWLSVCWTPDIKINQADAGVFVAVGSGTSGYRVMTSPDGSNWTRRSTPADLNWRSVCYSPDLKLFCAVADSGTTNACIMTSPDAVNWTLRTAPSSNQWKSICWSSELLTFCAVSLTGTGNRVMVSADGVTWTSMNSGTDLNYHSVCWSPAQHKFVAVATTSLSAGTSRTMYFNGMSGAYQLQMIQQTPYAISDSTKYAMRAVVRKVPTFDSVTYWHVFRTYTNDVFYTSGHNKFRTENFALSFDFLSNITGTSTFTVSIQTLSYSYSYVTTFTYTGPGTQRISITIPYPNTFSNFDSSNRQLSIGIATGIVVTTTTTLNAWQSGSYWTAPTGVTQWWNTVGNWIQIANVNMVDVNAIKQTGDPRPPLQLSTLYDGANMSVSGNMSTTGYIQPSAGQGNNGIIFPLNPGGGGGGDSASIKYWAFSGENCCLEIALANDSADFTRLWVPNYSVVQIGTPSYYHINNFPLYNSNGQQAIAFSWEGYLISSGRGFLFGANGTAYGGGWAVNSDIRIKKNIRDLDDLECLQLLRRIKPVQYQLILDDAVPVYGFIAQNINSVLPYAVDLRNGFIPNLLCNGVLTKDANSVTLTLSQAISSETWDSIKEGLSVKFKDIDTGSYHQAKINSKNLESLSLNIELHNTGTITFPSQVFVEGTEVDDFEYIDKNAIFTVATAAVQELDREIQSLTAQLQTATQQIQILTQFIQSKFPDFNPSGTP